MTISAKNNTPAHRAAQRPRPLPVYTQAQTRDRRRAGLLHTYSGRWSLTAEVAAICDPLAELVATAPRPAAYWRPVDDLAVAVHGLVHAAVGLLVRADAERRTAHLGVDDRGRSIRALVDLAERPRLPEIGDETLAAGTWGATLTALAEPYTDGLSGLLGRALTSVVSDRLLVALRDVDRAAMVLERRLDRDEQTSAAKTANPPDRGRPRPG